MLIIVLLARALGTRDYGALVGFSGLAMIVGTLSWLGGSDLLLEAATRDRYVFSRYWHAAIHSTVWIAALLVTLCLFVAPLLLRVPLPLMPLLALATSEILCYPLVYACGFSFQAHER